MEPNSILDFLKNPAGQFFLIDSNTLYYTYSTIAQTLAGAFGILGAFVLFRLQGINQKLKTICSFIYNGASDQHPCIRIPFAQENWDDFYKVIENRVLTDIVYNRFNIDQSDFDNYKEALKKKLELKEKITKKAHKTLRLTLFPIALSLLCLPISPLLSQYSIVSLVVLAIAIAASIKCLFLYLSLVGDALELGQSKTKPKEPSQ